VHLDPADFAIVTALSISLSLWYERRFPNQLQHVNFLRALHGMTSPLTSSHPPMSLQEAPEPFYHTIFLVASS
jgi:hypothetical protein